MLQNDSIPVYWTTAIVGMLSFLALLTSDTAEAGKGPGLVTAKAIEDVLRPLRKKHDVPGLAAAVVSNRGLLAMASTGVRKRDSDAKLGPDDLYHLGSDTKPITAWLIAWLIERGKLGWNTALEKIFPELANEMSPELKKITVAHLLTHHSGLPANWPGGWWQLHNDQSPRQQRQLIMTRLMMTKKAKIELDHKPGEKYQYSNLGYVIAGAIAEKIADDSWENLVRRELFDPLKVTHVGFGPVGKPHSLEQPWSHDDKGKPVSPGLRADNPPVMGPAGRVHISLADWSAIIADTIRGVRGEKALLKPATYQKMMTTPYLDRFYCLGGWAGNPKTVRGQVQLMHDGSNTFNYCCALVIPEENLGILVVTNQGGDAARQACTDARDALRMIRVR